MIISSIGIGIGLAVTELTSAASETTAVLQGLAAGTLVYVVMFEVTPSRFYEPSPSCASSFIAALSHCKL